MQNDLKHLKDVIKVRFSVRKYSILRLKNYAKVVVCYDQTKQKSQKKNNWRSGKTLQ